jgi:hypothetical protein
MKVVTAALAIFFLAGLQSFDSGLPALAQDKQEDEGVKKARRIDRAVGWLSNDDLEVREMGRKELMSIGPEVIPAIEKRIAEKGLTELVQMLRHFDRTPSVAESWVAEAQLKDIEADEEFKKAAAKLSKADGEKYVYVKYQEAMAHVRKKHYQRALELANALVAFEPKSSHLEAFRLLRRHCENMITQTSLIEAKLFQPKIWYVEGEPVELTARMKNLYKAMINITWEKATATEAGGGLLVCDVEVTMKEFNGFSSTDQKHQELRFEEEIPIAPGAQWERKFTIDTSTAIADQNQVRTIKIGGWTQPMKMATDGVNVTRRLQFEPAVVKIIPKKYGHFLDRPMDSFEKAVAEGTPLEIYVASQLLEGADRDRATGKLIQLLAKSNTVISKNTAANLLTAHTGQALGIDAKRWENWHNNRLAENKDKNQK